MKIEGKVVIVTGSAQGIGKAHAEAFLQRGAKVCVCDILAAEGEATTEELGQRYGRDRVMFVACDVTKKDQFLHVFDETIRTFGALHVLVNNAGLNEQEDYRGLIDVNLTAVICGTFEAVKRMRKENGGEGGVIVNIASNLGLYMVPKMPVYTATKQGVIGFSRNYALTLGDVSQHGVRINVVCPGVVKTRMTEPFMALMKTDLKEVFDKEGGFTPPETIADGTIRLVEDDTLNGAVFHVNVLHQKRVY